MRKVYLALIKVLFCAFALGLFFACENEINTTGSGLIGDVNFDTNLSSDFSTVSYTMNYPEGVQTNGVPVGVLGAYNDLVYGKTTASFLSQMTLTSFDPEFGVLPTIDSVVFEMPYFSTATDIDENNNTIYDLDSVFGEIAPLKLSLYQSNFFLNTLDPDTGFENPEVYLSTDIHSEFGAIDESLLQAVLLDVELNENGEQNPSELEKLTSFTPSSDEIILTRIVEDEDEDEDIPDNPIFEESERLSPRLRVKLDKNYWKELIINQEGTTNLLNLNSFNNYFRGLYLKIDDVGNNAFYTFFNIAETNITIYYSSVGGEGLEQDEISLNLSGVNIVDYKNDFNSEIEEALTNSNQEIGEENLYLKGGDGSIAVIDMFGPRTIGTDGEEIQDELETLKSCGVIINEANLTFFVDQDEAFLGLGEAEPERVFMFDIDNNIILADAVFDGTSGSEGPIDAETNHLGRLTRTEEGDVTTPGVSYRIRLTQHINNIINNDSTNVKLGLAVSQNVITSETSLIEGTGDLDSGIRIPVASVISPEGTVLHGNLSKDEEKKLKLRIYYTLTEEVDPNSPCGQLLGL